MAATNKFQPYLAGIPLIAGCTNRQEFTALVEGTQLSLSNAFKGSIILHILTISANNAYFSCGGQVFLSFPVFAKWFEWLGD